MGALVQILRQGATWLFTTLNANGILVLLGSFFTGSSSDDKDNYKIGITALISMFITYIVLKKMR